MMGVAEAAVNVFEAIKCLPKVVAKDAMVKLKQSRRIIP
jgi:hypothetical protein